MAGYVESALIKGEQIVHQGKISMLSMVGSFIIGGFALLVGLSMTMVSGGAAFFWFALGVAVIALAWLRRKTTELAVTNKRVIAKTGVVSRHTVELNLSKVESIKVEQSIVGRMLGYGSIVVGGTGSTHAPIPFIDDPMSFKRAVSEATDQLQTGVDAPQARVPRAAEMST